MFWSSHTRFRARRYFRYTSLASAHPRPIGVRHEAVFCGAGRKSCHHRDRRRRNDSSGDRHCRVSRRQSRAGGEGRVGADRQSGERSVRCARQLRADVRTGRVAESQQLSEASAALRDQGNSCRGQRRSHQQHSHSWQRDGGRVRIGVRRPQGIARGVGQESRTTTSRRRLPRSRSIRSDR